MEKERLIPTQQIGQQTDAEEEKIYTTQEDALAAYHTAAERLQDVNKWHEISSIEASCFTLFDNQGIQLDRKARQGDYIRIDIPGPGNSVGEGYDWVYVEHLEKYSNTEENVDFTLLVARPSKNPGNSEDKIAHFFSDLATSTFMAFRKVNVLSVEVHGRNELPNSYEQKLLDQLRNLMVNGGSAIGMSFIQWHLLVSGILNKL